MNRLRWMMVALALFVLPTVAFAQKREADLSDAEIEQIRESAYIANDRVMVFIKLMNVRVEALANLYGKPRRPGREEDTHDLLEQIGAIADELDDNLDDYGTRPRDIRKALPKLAEATERWATVIRTPPDHTAYNVARKIALESIDDLRESATKLLEEQKAWFKEHPPQKEDNYTEQTHPR